MGVGTQRDTERTRKTKISKLQIVATVNKQILRFEITMQNTVRVAIKQAGSQLMREFL
jgi:hypothetical protein